jgi:16S rRNA (guanine1207-N2)-methyltransferase
VFAAQIEADAADRLTLDEASALHDGADVVVIGSAALADGAEAAGAARVSLHLDSAADADADADAAGRAEAAGRGWRDLTDELLSAATVVLLRLPKSLDELDRIAHLVASSVGPNTVLIAGGRLKYMTIAMNEVLLRSFATVDASLARQKSRVLTAKSPLPVTPLKPRRRFHADLDLWVAAAGGVFAGTSIDIGTRAMLGTFDRLPEFETAIDLGSGSGILAAKLKRARPAARVIASDASSVACESARDTMIANDLDVEVVRSDGLASQPDDSADLIVLNPPFHDGGAVTTDIAHHLFGEAARVLRPGGELRTVWNSHLAYRAALTRTVGPTRELARTPKFTVTASSARVEHDTTTR